MRLGTERNAHFTAVDKMSTCKVALWLTFDLYHCFWKTSGTVIYKALIAIPEDGHGGVVAHNSEGRSKANPPALTLSPTALVIITSLTGKWKAAGCRMALELQQSGKGTTGRWLSGARRDAEVEQGGGGSLNLLFLFSLLSNCYSLISHSQLFVCCGLVHLSLRQLSKLHCCLGQSV